MSDIINLRQFKKKKNRAAKEQQADQNRIRFGRTKIEKEFARKKAQEVEQFLSSNQLEPGNREDQDN